MVIGIAVGIGVYTFAYAKGWSYLTDDAAACANCCNSVYGHHHAVRDRTEPGLLRQRLSARRGLLAPGRDFRRDLFRGIYDHRCPLDAGDW